MFFEMNCTEILNCFSHTPHIYLMFVLTTIVVDESLASIFNKLQR